MHVIRKHCVIEHGRFETSVEFGICVESWNHNGPGNGGCFYLMIKAQRKVTERVGMEKGQRTVLTRCSGTRESKCFCQHFHQLSPTITKTLQIESADFSAGSVFQ